MDGSRFGYDGSADEPWHSDIDFVGSASDPEDGSLTGSALVWTTDRTNTPHHSSAVLGFGGTITASLYSDNCPGVWHEITLTATDSDGNIVATSIKIWIYDDHDRCQDYNETSSPPPID